MNTAIIQKSGTGWGGDEDQATYTRIHHPGAPRSSQIHRDDLWIEFLAQLRDWSADPASIPLEEGDDPIPPEVAKRAFEHAFALYYSGKIAPTMVVPSSDGAIVLERHIKHDNGRLVAFEYWSLRYTPDGVNDTVVNWVVPTRYWTSGSMRAN